MIKLKWWEYLLMAAAITLVIAIISMTPGCGSDVAFADEPGGVPWSVTAIAPDGETFEWKSVTNVTTRDGFVFFFDAEGVEHHIVGGLIIVKRRILR